MIKISDLLGRFSKMAAESDTVKAEVARIVTECGVTIRDANKITIRKGIATLGLSSIQKSEVALKQQKILSALSGNPLTKSITVVR